MEKRKLGKGRLEVSAIGMSCMGLNHAYDEPVDRKQTEAVIGRPIELGCDFFDTAEVHGTPDNPHPQKETTQRGARPADCVPTTSTSTINIAWTPM